MQSHMGVEIKLAVLKVTESAHLFEAEREAHIQFGAWVPGLGAFDLAWGEGRKVVDHEVYPVVFLDHSLQVFEVGA
jgi:hypothetical protein